MTDGGHRTSPDIDRNMAGVASLRVAKVMNIEMSCRCQGRTQRPPRLWAVKARDGHIGRNGLAELGNEDAILRRNKRLF